MPRITRRIRVRFTTFTGETPSGYGHANIRTYARPVGRHRGKYAGIRLAEPIGIKMFGFVPVALNSPGAIRKRA